MAMRVDFNPENLGFFPVDDFAEYLGVTRKSVYGWLQKESTDSKYIKKINNLHRYYQFPVESPPFPADVISHSAKKAFQHLRKGNAELAELITHRSLSSGTDWQWELEEKPKMTPLQEVYCELANALSWQRSPNYEHQKKGCDDLVLLRHKLKSLMKKPVDTMGLSIMGQPFEYAYLMVSVRVAAYLVTKDIDSFYRRDFFQKNLCSFFRELQQRSSVYNKSYLRALIDWNAAQVSALNKDYALFIMSIDGLKYVYGSHFHIILAKLEADKDTKAMLEHERVKNYCL